MRDNEKIKNQTDDKSNIYKPILIVTVVLVVIIGCYIWLGVKKPVIFGNIRDLTITLIFFVLFVINTVLAVLFFIFAARIENAKEKIDEVMTNADGKVEEAGDQITIILKKILEPVFESSANNAGILKVLSTLMKKETN